MTTIKNSTQLTLSEVSTLVNNINKAVGIVPINCPKCSGLNLIESIDELYDVFIFQSRCKQCGFTNSYITTVNDPQQNPTKEITNG